MSTTFDKLYLAAQAAAFVTLLAPAIAHADEAPMDEVALQNGGLIKGEILVMDPGEKVVIQVPGEENPRTIVWSEVSDVQRAAGGDGEAKIAEEPVDDAKQERTEGPGVVRLRIESDDPDVYLVEHQMTGSVVTPYGTLVGIRSNSICNAPCDKVIDARADRRYTIVGDHIRPSEPFSLSQYQGDVTANVQGSSTALTALGGTATALGALSMVTGAIVTPLGFTSIGDDKPFLKPMGIGMLVGGGVVLAAGIVMTAFSGTDVELEPKPSRQARKPRIWRGEF